jgi:hypothetical protein
MFQQFRKYRNFLTIGILGFYLAGGLQFPMLECLHFLTHVGDLAKGNYESHRFHSHSDNHQHITLAVLAVVDQPDQPNSTPVDETSDLSIKKFPQFFQSQPDRFVFRLKKQTRHFAAAKKLRSTTAPVPSPPPRS